MRRPRNRVKEAAQVVVAVAVIAAAGFLFRAVVTIGAPPKYTPEYSVEYTVKQGDTLWTIAEKVANDTSKKEINKIKAANSLGTDYIMPGQKLLIPIKENID